MKEISRENARVSLQVVPRALGPFAPPLFSATRPRKRKYKGVVEAAGQKEREKHRGKNEKRGLVKWST